MKKITIEFEDGSVDVIEATSFFLHAINSETMDHTRTGSVRDVNQDYMVIVAGLCAEAHLARTDILRDAKEAGVSPRKIKKELKGMENTFLKEFADVE